MNNDTSIGLIVVVALFGVALGIFFGSLMMEQKMYNNYCVFEGYRSAVTVDDGWACQSGTEFNFIGWSTEID